MVDAQAGLQDESTKSLEARGDTGAEAVAGGLPVPLPEGVPVVFICGAMAHGHVDVSYTDDFISVSEFPLSAACCLGRICNALEAKFDIV